MVIFIRIPHSHICSGERGLQEEIFVIVNYSEKTKRLSGDCQRLGGAEQRGDFPLGSSIADVYQSYEGVVPAEGYPGMPGKYYTSLVHRLRQGIQAI
jgi:hypothetical protein